MAFSGALGRGWQEGLGSGSLWLLDSQEAEVSATSLRDQV